MTSDVNVWSFRYDLHTDRKLVMFSCSLCGLFLLLDLLLGVICLLWITDIYTWGLTICHVTTSWPVDSIRVLWTREYVTLFRSWVYVAVAVAAEQEQTVVDAVLH